MKQFSLARLWMMLCNVTVQNNKTSLALFCFKVFLLLLLENEILIFSEL